MSFTLAITCDTLCVKDPTKLLQAVIEVWHGLCVLHSGIKLLYEQT